MTTRSPLSSQVVVFFATMLTCVAIPEPDASAGTSQRTEILWVALPDSVNPAYKELEDRLYNAVLKNGDPMMRRSPVGLPRTTINNVILQTNIIMGVEHFYGGRLGKSHELLSAAWQTLDSNPGILREGLVSLTQVREAAMLMVRLHLEAGKLAEAEHRMRWLLFTFPNAAITLEKYPNQVVQMAVELRQRMAQEIGTVHWSARSATGQCSLLLNGARSFSSSPANIPAGNHVVSFRCGETESWQRQVRVNQGISMHIQSAPDLENELVLQTDKVTLSTWPREQSFFRDLATLLGMRVTYLTPRTHPGGAGLLLVVESIDLHGNHQTLAWTEVPESELGASTSALVMGELPARDRKHHSVGPSPWSWAAYGTGAALVIGGGVFNIMHNNASTSRPTVNSVNDGASMRKSAVALYASGGASLLLGALLHLLDDGKAPTNPERVTRTQPNPTGSLAGHGAGL